jgi:hypothetical protein
MHHPKNPVNSAEEFNHPTQGKCVQSERQPAYRAAAYLSHSILTQVPRREGMLAVPLLGVGRALEPVPP